jgi:hypothetical protein
MVLTIVYNTQNQWVFGLCQSFETLNNQKTQRSENWMFPFSGLGNETPTLLGLIERTNLSHWITENYGE